MHICIRHSWKGFDLNISKYYMHELPQGLLYMQNMGKCINVGINLGKCK